jgi:hypothetical protein
MMDLRALAKVWCARSPSGRYIMHGVPRNRWCDRCGSMATKWHEHCTDNKKKGDAVMARLSVRSRDTAPP